MDMINPNATFEKDDIFHRVQYVQMAMRLTKRHPVDRGACVIAIDSPWGMENQLF